MKPLHVTIDLRLSPAQVKALIKLASERVFVPNVLSDLDKRQLVRAGVRVAIAKARMMSVLNKPGE